MFGRVLCGRGRRDNLALKYRSQPDQSFRVQTVPEREVRPNYEGQINHQASTATCFKECGAIFRLALKVPKQQVDKLQCETVFKGTATQHSGGICCS